MKTISIKCTLSVVLSIFLAIAMFTPIVYAAEPRYTDLVSAYCDLNIVGGTAECVARAIGRTRDNIYRITMVLYQDDNDYASWEAQDLLSVELNETCYVTRDHEYYVGIYVAVYDPNGNFIEDAIAYTGTYYY